MFGPLYHLSSPADRLTALTEAGRVLRPGGLLLVSAISRVNNFLDGILGHGGTDTTDEEVAVLSGGSRAHGRTGSERAPRGTHRGPHPASARERDAHLASRCPA